MLCGGNIDLTVLGRVIERGLAADGRLVRFTCSVSDRPGGIARLTAVLSGQGSSIKDIFHERAWLDSDVSSVSVSVVSALRPCPCCSAQTFSCLFPYPKTLPILHPRCALSSRYLTATTPSVCARLSKRKTTTSSGTHERATKWTRP